MKLAFRFPAPAGWQNWVAHYDVLATVSDLAKALDPKAQPPAGQRLTLHDTRSGALDPDLSLASLDAGAGQLFSPLAATDFNPAPPARRAAPVNLDLPKPVAPREFALPAAPNFLLPTLASLGVAGAGILLLFTAFFTFYLRYILLGFILLAFLALAVVFVSYWLVSHQKTVQKAFNLRIKNLRENCEQAASGEYEYYNSHWPAPATWAQTLAQGGPLWEQDLPESRFGVLRLGTARHTPSFTLNPAPATPAPTLGYLPFSFTPNNLSEKNNFEISALLGRFQILEDFPLTVDLRERCGFGIFGPPKKRWDLLRAALVSLLATHHPSTFNLAVMSTAGNELADLMWSKAVSNCADLLGVNPLAATMTEAKTLITALENLVESREGNAGKPGAVIIVADGSVGESPRLARLAQMGVDHDVYFLWTADHRSQVPATCRNWVELNAAIPTLTSNQNGVKNFSPDVLNPAEFAKILELLGQWRESQLLSDLQLLPNGLCLDDLYDFSTEGDRHLAQKKWEKNTDVSRLVCGYGENGVLRSPLGSLSLVCGINAGQLQASTQGLLASLTAQVGPGRAQILALGPVFAQAARLAHTIGYLPNPSGQQSQRLLTTLRSLSARRRELVNQKQAGDWATFIAQNPQHPQAYRLLVCVGDCAQFNTSLLEELASLGASQLGIHLLFATTRVMGLPAALINKSTLRLTGRLGNLSEYQHFLGPEFRRDPDKFFLHPGRAMAAFSGQYFPLITPNAGVDPGHLRLQAIGFNAPADESKPGALRPDFTVFTDFINSCVTPQLPVREPAWSPGLAAVNDLSKLATGSDQYLPLGLADYPAGSPKAVYFQPETHGSLAVFGAPGSGRSQTLSTIAIGSAHTPKSGPVHVYALQQGDSLTPLAQLDHVGGVYHYGEEDQVSALVSFLDSLTQSRLESFSLLGAQNLSQYRELSAKTPKDGDGSNPDPVQTPRIIVLLDDLEAFLQRYQVSDSLPATHPIVSTLLNVLTAGRALGIHLVVSAEHFTTLPPAWRAAFGKRLILSMGYKTNLVALNPDLPENSDPFDRVYRPGLALSPDDPNLIQVAVAGMDPSPLAQKNLIHKLSSLKCPLPPVDPAAQKLHEAHIWASQMPESLDGLPLLGLRLPAGVPVSFQARGQLLLCGPGRSGRTNAMRWLGQSLRRAYPDMGLLHASMNTSALTGLQLWDESVTGAKALGDFLDQLKAAACHVSPAQHPGLGIFFEDFPALAQVARLEHSLLELFELCKAGGHFIVAEGPIDQWRDQLPLLSGVKKGGRALCLASAVESVRAIFPSLALPATVFSPGTGWWIEDGKVQSLRLPLAGG